MIQYKEIDQPTWVFKKVGGFDYIVRKNIVGTVYKIETDIFPNWLIDDIIIYKEANENYRIAHLGTGAPLFICGFENVTKDEVVMKFNEFIHTLTALQWTDALKKFDDRHNREYHPLDAKPELPVKTESEVQLKLF